MNKTYIYTSIGIALISSVFYGYEIKTHSINDKISPLTFTDLDKNKILDMDFNDNAITNNVTNKNYSTAKGSGRLVSSIKGNGFELNNDYIKIPKSDLDIKDTDTVMTVAFTYKYDGSDPDNNGYIISFGNYNLHLGTSNIGFNTMSNDIYGTAHNFQKGKTYHIIAEFNKENVGLNKIYINGVSKTLKGDNPYVNSRALFDNDLTVGTITNDLNSTNYPINEPSVIDEIKIYKKALTQVEVNNVSNAHKIPELRGEVINNSYPKLSWATEILPEDVLWASGYDTELGDKLPNLKYGTFASTGGQSFVTNDKYNGSTSLKIEDTFTNGNFYNAPAIEALDDDSVNIFDGIIGLKNEVPLTISYRAKSNNDSSYTRFWGIGGEETSFYYYKSTVAKDVKKGDKTIEIVDMKNDKDIMSRLNSDGTFVQPYYLNFDPDRYNLEFGTIYPVRADIENNLLIFDKAIPRDISAGEKLYRRPSASPFKTGTYKKISGNNEWNLYSENATINISEDRFDLATRPIKFVIGVKTSNTFNIDDIKVGYSTKVRLYRDNSKVYEGYESEFNDTLAKDKAIPTAVTNIISNMTMINANNSTRRININFESAKDNGTTYNYQISAISKDGVETPKSNVLEQTVKSGVKGYSYVIDKNPTTIPDNTVNITGTNISKDITDAGTYYLHIKTIDNEGNVSGTVHYKIDIPVLTAKANPKEDKIRLDWNMDDLKNKSFKVHKRQEGETNFQTISMSNIDTSKQVKVLNIFPTYNVPLKNDGSVDLNNKPMHQSGMLNEWIRDYGMGAINVDSINKEDFENDPNRWLKDESGEYKYDVVVVGFWNISVREQHLNNNGSDAIGEFIDSGRGVLAGHHHIGYREFDYGLNRLKTKFGVKLIKETGAYQTELGNIDYVLPENSPGMDNSYYWNLGTQVKATKKGILLNYPHNIADEGKIFTIPKSHDSWEFATGDVWMQYVNQNAYVAPFDLPAKDITILPDGSSGTSNAYLHTYNNTAIIQTGHSDNVATEDEKKIVANTLFYLNQLSTDNYLDDNSGQDVKAPNMPQIYEHNFVGSDRVEVKFNEVSDNGTTYEYYVESQTKDNNNLTLSNVVSETITSGIKGYSYVIDSNPNTIPDVDIEISKAETISLTLDDNTERYIHIRAIDNVGNASETYHYKISDDTHPTMTITGNPTEWTNQDVVLAVKARDDESGLSHIILPNGSIIRGNSANYTITTNGRYIFKAVDKMGNETVETIVVNKIDKASPVLNTNKVINNNKTEAMITLTMSDTLSGIDYLELPNGTKVINSNSYTFTTADNGLYPFTLYDKVGNKTVVMVDVFELNANIVPSEIDKIEYKLSGATTKDWTEYREAFYVTNEGITNITARSYDKAGNLSDETTSIVRIDKTKPNSNSIKIELK